MYGDLICSVHTYRRDSSSGRASASCAVGQDGCRIDTWPRHTKDVIKMVPVATLLGAQHYKASTGFSSLTNHASLASHNEQKKKKSLIIINVCIDRRTEWKTGIRAKFVILLKYRNYYYYYYYYYTVNNLCMFNWQCHFYLCNRGPYVRLALVPNMLSS